MGTFAVARRVLGDCPFTPPRAAAWALFAALAWPAAPTAAETFDLRFYRYCAPGTLCDHASEAAYQQYICEAVEEMNLEWKPVGISFRPIVMPVDSTGPTGNTGLPAGKDKYYLNPGCADDDSFTPLRNYWRDHVARAHTDSLSMMLTADWNTCCSGIPRTFKNLDHQHGIWCDADPARTAENTGQVWAHEMGHHWSLSHTHGGYADTANGEDPTFDADAAEVFGCSEWNEDGDAVGCGDDQDCADEGLGTCSETDGLPGVEDTPADRGGFETCNLVCENDDDRACATNADCPGNTGPCGCSKDDETAAGNIRNNHTWFASASSERDILATSSGISAGSPHATWCNIEIKDRVGGVTNGSDTTPSVEVTARDAMSYHPSGCRAPYVRNGVRREAFTTDQIVRIKECRQQIDPRQAANLPDVCFSRGGDDDSDGICDTDDNCPQGRNTCQTDTDGDGDGDVCDLCPNNPSPTGDMDGDGIGDLCDDDRDGDGCLNGADDHPDQGLMPTITTLFVGCPIETETQYVSDGADTDGDGAPNCADPDDDNDGLCDAPGRGCEGDDHLCPEVKGLCIVPNGGNPCPPAWFMCGQNCVEFFLKFTNVVNPDPTADLVFDRIWMSNRTLFAAPLAGQTASESVVSVFQKALGGAAGPGPAAAGAVTERIRLEVWQRPPGGIERRVAVIGEYDASRLRNREIVRGGLLRLRPGMDVTGLPILEVETTTGVGIEADEARDADGDGVADSEDNCVLARNPRQVDADGDGFGNACDADLDQDGLVDEEDVGRYGACRGADLSVSVPLREPDRFDGEGLGQPPPEPDRVHAALATICAATDFDGNGVVDETDGRLAEGRRGLPPGPTAVDRGLRPPAPPLSPVCADPGPIQNARIRLAGLRRPPGSQSVNLGGTLILSAPFDPPLDPVTHGVSLHVTDGTSNTMMSVRIPGGALDETGAGWTPINRGRGARYVNPEGPGGVTSVVLRWNNTGAVRVRVKGDRLERLRDLTLPLRWEVNLDPEPAATDQCGHTAFVAAPGQPSCSVLQGGSTIVCR